MWHCEYYAPTYRRAAARRERDQALCSRKVDIALAEFNTLRAEILGRLSAQNTLVGVCLTVTGVVFGVLLSRKGVSVQAALVLPPIVSGLGLFYLYNARAQLIIGIYIRDHLWPRLYEPEEGLSWELFIHDYRRGAAFASKWARVRWMLLEPLASTTVFLLPSGVALVTCGPT